MPARATDIQTVLSTRLQQFIEDLRLLTSIDCGTANRVGANRAGEWVRARCENNGWTTRVHSRSVGGDIVEARVAGVGRARILLLAHMDTVYPDGVAAARPMRIDGNRIIGPGTADMKGGLLAAVYAAEAMETLQIRPFGELVLLFTADEEIGSPESTELIEATAKTCDAALVLEPARVSGAVVAARKGVVDYRIDVQGRAAHSGVEPEKGRSAIVELAHKVLALQALNGVVAGGIVNVGIVNGGSALNVVPDTATVRFQMRAPDPESLEELDRRIQAIASSVTVPDTTTSLTTHRGHSPMARTAAIERLVSLAREVARELGFDLQAVATGGASDACTVAHAEVPVLDGLGPIGGNAHSEGEWLAADSIVPRTALLGGLIARIAEG